MPTEAKAIPDGYHTVTPYLSIKGAAQAIEFYQRAFGARELYRLPMPDGRVGHAELQVGDCRLMLADEMLEMPDAVALSPGTLRGTSVGLCLYVEDADAVFARAVEAGAQVKRAVADQFYGDRSGILQDPFGHIWTIATHVEDVTPDEMKRRMAAMGPSGSAA